MLHMFNSHTRTICVVFQEGPGPEGHRGARVVWVCDGKYLLVSGFDRYSGINELWLTTLAAVRP